jgi:hypothetical protein
VDRVCAADATIFCAHPKLHPGISYSHTQNKVRLNIHPLDHRGSHLIEEGRAMAADNQAIVPPKLEWSTELGTSGFVFSRSGASGAWCKVPHTV